MMTPAIADSYAREMQHDLRAEAAVEAVARRLAPGPFDRLCAALRGRRATPAPVARPATALTPPTAAR